MYRSILKKLTAIMMTAAVLGSTAGCVPKTTETVAHIETGALIDVVEQISDECIANHDTDGAHDAWHTFLFLDSFCCIPWVNYDDIKNKNFENLNYRTGELLLSLAAYNECNDESAMDVEVDWITHYNSLTQEQLDAMETYAEWYQTTSAYDIREEYDDRFYQAYMDIREMNDIAVGPAYDDLTPAQFREVQNYINDTNYQVDTSLWDNSSQLR